MILKATVHVKEPISTTIKRYKFATKQLPKRGVKTKEGQVIYY